MHMMNKTQTLRFFPAEDLKKAILHQDAEIRKIASDYFKESVSSDESVMLLIIQAVENYGRENSLGLVCHSYTLAQTPGTLEWILHELENKKGNDFKFKLNLCKMG